MNINRLAARMVLNEQEEQLQLRIPEPLSPSHVILVAPMNYSVRSAIEIQMLFNVAPLIDIVCRFHTLSLSVIIDTLPAISTLVCLFVSVYFVWVFFLFFFFFVLKICLPFLILLPPPLRLH